MTTQLATGTVTYVPPVPVNLGRQPGRYNSYIALARYADANLLQTCYSPATNVTLISLPCTNGESSSIVPSQGGTNVLLICRTEIILLQDTTNLVPPINWVNVYYRSESVRLSVLMFGRIPSVPTAG